MVDGAHVDVVDVEQQAAVGALGELARGTPTRVIVEAAKLDVARDVLEQRCAGRAASWTCADARGDVRERLFGVGQRQQVVQVAPVDAGPAEVIGDPGRLEASRERRSVAQVRAIERIGAADRHRDAVQHDRIALRGCARGACSGAAARDEIVLGDHLEPVDARSAGQDLARNGRCRSPRPNPSRLFMRGPGRVAGRLRSAPRSGRNATRQPPSFHFGLGGFALALVISTKPLPLHEFCPCSHWSPSGSRTCPCSC